MKYLRQVRKGIDYIEAHLDSDVDLADVARHAGFSQWHFQRIFKALTNAQAPLGPDVVARDATKSPRVPKCHAVRVDLLRSSATASGHGNCTERLLVVGTVGGSGASAERGRCTNLG